MGYMRDALLATVQNTDRTNPNFWAAIAAVGPKSWIENVEEYKAAKEAAELTNDFRVEAVLRWWMHGYWSEYHRDGWGDCEV